LKKHIPNIISLLNLFGGCVGIVFAIQGELALASYSVGLAAVFDFFDGLAARLLNAKSEMGKQLDSLADVISFGLLPGTIIYGLMFLDLGGPKFYISGINVIPFFGFLIPVFSAIRLAKFNIDERQTEIFLGLPTPANGILIASLPLIMMQETTLIIIEINFLKEFISNSYFLIILTVLLSWLLVAEIPLMSLKFKSYSWEGNELRYSILASAILLFILFYFVSIPLIILLYIFLSLIYRKTITNTIQ